MVIDFNSYKSKANSIRFVAQLENIAENNIYTIGDSYSDIEMIRKFKGFSMNNSIQELKQQQIRWFLVV